VKYDVAKNRSALSLTLYSWIYGRIKTVYEKERERQRPGRVKTRGRGCDKTPTII